jgi:hypothetical protein
MKTLLFAWGIFIQVSSRHTQICSNGCYH